MNLNQSRQEAEQTRGMGILLIDFNKSSRAFFNTVLSKTGEFMVWTVASPQEAIDALPDIPEREVHFILIDASFLGENSDAVLLQKILSHPATFEADLILLSDSVGEEEKVLFQELGIRHVMPKQVGGGALMKELRVIVANCESKKVERKICSDLARALLNQDVSAVEQLLEDPALAHFVRSKPEHLHLHGETLLLRKKPEEAVTFLREAIKSREKMGEGATLRCLSTLGKALCSLGKYDEALKVFDTLAAKSPLNLMHGVLAGNALLDKGDFASAARRFEDVLKRDGDNRDALLGLGKASLAMGEVEKAFVELSRIKGDVESYSLASYFNNAGVALTRAGRIAEARSFFERSLPLFQKYRFVIEFNLGLAHLRLGEAGVAVRYFEAASRGDAEGLLSEKKVMQAYRKLGAEEFVRLADLKQLGETLSY